MSELDLEAVRRTVYPLMAYDFQGGLGINRVINEIVPALIAEVERLRSLARLTEIHENIEHSSVITRDGHPSERQG